MSLVYRQKLSNHQPTLPWYPDAKEVNEIPGLQEGTYLYKMIFFHLDKYRFFQKIPKLFMGPLYYTPE